MLLKKDLTLGYRLSAFEQLGPESKFHWQRLGSSAWNPESTVWNPESKSLLDSLPWGE